jgi:orotidine-5'-phosphate decarboxylase
MSGAALALPWNRCSREELSARERLIVALDFSTAEDAQKIVEELGDTVSFYKIGLQLQLAPKLRQLFNRLTKEKKNIFVDFKYIDIPATIEAVVRSASMLNIRFITVIGQDHIVEAAIKGRGDTDLKILAVTLLTGMSETDMRKAYSTTVSLEKFVSDRAKDVISIGCDGVICSPQEISLIRRTVSEVMPGHNFLVVTPGIRPAGVSRDDQKRTATPYDAIMNGADYLVVGRPITRSANPTEAAQHIIDQMGWALEERSNSSASALPVPAEID